MGNRAVISFEGSEVGIYLHWNGGPESVLAFLDAAKACKVRDPLVDCYGIARLAQIIGNFFGTAESLGVDELTKLDCDNGDNGQYVVGENWVITKWIGRHTDSGVLTADKLTDETRQKYENIRDACIKQWAIVQTFGE